jgi:imidazole glycerol phosphate synthase glutamine amidotransferase subunit
MTVLVVQTGSANLASVLAGLVRAGAAPRLSTCAAELADAERVVLPGVGAFGAVAARLRERGLVEVLRDRILAGRATLAICLGMQLLCEASEESPGVRGLGVIPQTIQRFPDDVRVPQLGWNRITSQPSCHFLAPGFAYFANSYCLAVPPAGWQHATAEHGMPFVAAVERGAVLACQFHPELSGAFGATLLRRWLAGGAASC